VHSHGELTQQSTNFSLPTDKQPALSQTSTPDISLRVFLLFVIRGIKIGSTQFVEPGMK
jgi:hypothetical protein